MRNVDIKYEKLPAQQVFHDSKSVNAYLSGGFGSGKTYALCMKALQLMAINRGMPGGMMAPSYKMYKRDVVPTMYDICKRNKIRYHYNKSDNEWHFPGLKSSMYGFTSEDDGESVKGPNLAWFCINEVASCSKNAVMIAMSRVRLIDAILPQVAMSGTPEGFNWSYEYFIEVPREDTQIIYADSSENKFVHTNYITRLMESYRTDPVMAEMYIKGMYVNMKGKRCAWSFNRIKHAADNVKQIEGLPIWIALDFNVNPMAATLFNCIPAGMKLNDPWGYKLLRGFKSFKIPSSNTYEMVDALRDYLKVDRDPSILQRTIVYPDPTGGSRSTKTRNFSDFDILKEGGFKNLKYNTSISVRDNLNALNGLLSKNLIMFDRVEARDAIADLEQCVFKGNVFEIDKTNEERTHWLDGIKNMCGYEFPIKRVSAREERIR